MPCFSYSHTPLTESKNIFFIFVRDEIPHFRFISFYSAQRFYLCLFTIFPRPRAYLIYIHAKPTRRQAIHCACAYTRVARHIPKLTPIAAITHRQEGQEME